MSQRTSLSKVLTHVEWALAGLIVVAPLAMGGTPTPFKVAAACASLVLLGLTLWATRGRTRLGLPAAVFGGTLLLALCWTLLQLAPVPCGWLEAIGHRPGLLAADSLRALGIERGSCRLTADLGRTMDTLFSGVAVGCTYFSAAIVCRFRSAERCVSALASATLAMAAVTLVHAAVGATRVYGLYAPSVEGLPVVSPIINANHLGGFLLLGFGLVLARSFISTEPGPRIWWYLALLMLGGAIVLTRSRGAIASSMMICCAYAAIRLNGPVQAGRRRRLGSAIALWVVGVLVAFAGSSFESLVTLVGEGGVGKIDVIRSLLAFSWDAPWLGVGRGALGPAFTASGISAFRAEHAESELVQLAVEWGWPLAVACAVSLAYLLFRALRDGRKSRRAAGAFASLMGFTTHSLLESQLEITGVAMAFVVLVAVCSTTKASERSNPAVIAWWERRVNWLRRSGPVAAWGVSLGAFVIALVFVGSMAGAHAVAISVDSAPCAERHEQLHALAEAHPLDALVAISGAEHFVATDEPEASLWINRALELAPKWTAPHLLAAHWLVRRGRLGQAAEELREAFALEAYPSRVDLLCWFARQPMAPSLIVAATPDGWKGELVLEQALSCATVSATAAEAIDRRALAQRPELAGPRARQMERSLQREEVAAARTLFDDRQGEETLALVRARARLLEAEGKRPEAIVLLTQHSGRDRESWPIVRELVVMHARAGDEVAVRDALGALHSVAEGSPRLLSETYVLRAHVFRMRGNRIGALDALERAYRLLPTNNVLRQIAKAAEELRLHARAYRAYDELCRSGLQDACESRERVRLAAQ